MVSNTKSYHDEKIRTLGTFLCDNLCEEQRHTELIRDEVMFRPLDMLDDDLKNVHAQAARVLMQCQSMEKVSLRIDCSDLTKESAKLLWKRASMRDIRSGFLIFRSIPCPVECVYVVEPGRSFVSWNIIKKVCPPMMSPKMRRRLVWVPPADQPCN
jgi:hypothetical protein